MPRPFKPTIIAFEMAQKNIPTLKERVQGFIKEIGLLPAGQRLVVAISGDADSVCLLHLLAGLREGLAVELYAAHLDHGLRGAESAADAEYVARLARRLAVPATIEKRDVGAYQKEHRISLEEAAREVRYRFLADSARAVGADRVAVGHTADDHVETILMHLVRGSGTRGLRGLQPLADWPLGGGQKITVIRPLLSISRGETDAYCRQYQLAPRLDSTNLSLSTFRNRIRLELLPLLEGYNPQVAEALLRTARIAADDLSFIDEEVERHWGEIARKQAATVTLDRDAFARLHPAIKRNLLRWAIATLGGSLKDIEAQHIEAIMAALDKPVGKQIGLPGGLVFVIGYGRYILGAEPLALCPFPEFEGEFTLKVPGKTELPGWLVEVAIIERQQMVGEDSDFVAYLDFDRAGDKLLVRSRRRGDRFQPLGLKQPKKLNEFMIDEKIPRAWRQRLPLVCSSEHIVWLAGGRIDERVKVTEDTKRVLRLEFRQS